MGFQNRVSTCKLTYCFGYVLPLSCSLPLCYLAKFGVDKDVLTLLKIWPSFSCSFKCWRCCLDLLFAHNRVRSYCVSETRSGESAVPTAGATHTHLL